MADSESWRAGTGTWRADGGGMGVMQGARRAVAAYERRRREVAALGALGAGFPLLATD
jgi:hypothetical protein